MFFNRQTLYANSLAKLNKMVYKGEADGNPNEVQLINNCIKFMEELDGILDLEEKNKLKKVEFICPLSKSRRNQLFGENEKVANDKIAIYVNPNLNGNGILTAYQRSRLYFFKELFKILHYEWITDAYNLEEKLEEVDFLRGMQSSMLIYGVDLLDEATSQEMAEELAYKMANKPRPLIREINFCGAKLITNFDSCTEYQQIAGKFAKTINGIGKFDDTQYALNLLAKKANKNNFIIEIVNEYIQKGLFLELLEMVEMMGEVVLTSYATSEIGEKEKNSTFKAIMHVNKLAESLRDLQEKGV